MPEMTERNRFDLRGRERVQTMNLEPSMTVQSDAHLADIENILAQYKEGAIQDLDATALEFRDVSQFTDLADALNQAKEAETEFLKLPSKIREIFGHSVAEWLDTAHDKEKRDALVKAGFIKEPEVVEPVKKPADPLEGKPTAPTERVEVTEGTE